jgi:hypothetical protein
MAAAVCVMGAAAGGCPGARLCSASADKLVSFILRMLPVVRQQRRHGPACRRWLAARGACGSAGCSRCGGGGTGAATAPSPVPCCACVRSAAPIACVCVRAARHTCGRRREGTARRSTCWRGCTSEWDAPRLRRGGGGGAAHRCRDLALEYSVLLSCHMRPGIAWVRALWHSVVGVRCRIAHSKCQARPADSVLRAIAAGTTATASLTPLLPHPSRPVAPPLCTPARCASLLRGRVCARVHPAPLSCVDCACAHSCVCA